MSIIKGDMSKFEPKQSTGFDYKKYLKEEAEQKGKSGDIQRQARSGILDLGSIGGGPDRDKLLSMAAFNARDIESMRRATSNFGDDVQWFKYGGDPFSNTNARYINLAQIRKQIEAHDAQKAAQELQRNRLDAASNYMKNIGSTIEGEVGAERKKIAGGLIDQTRALRGQAAGAGMLHSGRRQLYEGDIAREASSNLASARAEAINTVTNRAQQMFGSVLGDKATQELNALRQRAGLSEVQQNLKNQQTEQIGQGLGLLGQGAGSMAGSKNWFSSQPSIYAQYRPGTGQYITNRI